VGTGGENGEERRRNMWVEIGRVNVCVESSLKDGAVGTEEWCVYQVV